MANRNNTLLIKRSNIPDKIPPLSGLTLGELGLNTAEAKLYTLYTSGTTGATEVRQIGWDRLSTTGGTINGDLTVTGLGTFNSVSATTYYNLPISGLTAGTNISITGSNGNFTITSTINPGPFGISNSGGTYTYYTNLNNAMSAASAGQVVEMFADVLTTSGVTLKSNVIIQGNGHTYTYSGNTGDVFTTTPGNGTYTFMNINIRRSNTATSTGAIFLGDGTVFATNLVFKFIATYVSYTTTSGTAPITRMNGFGTYGWIIDGIDVVGNTSGALFDGSFSITNIKNSRLENTGSGGCISTPNVTGGVYHENLYVKTNSGTAISLNYTNQGDSIRNCIVISTSGIAVSGGFAYNCYAFSNTNSAFSGVQCYGCNGQTSTGRAYYSCVTFNSTGRSTTGYVIVPFFSVSEHYNGSFYSTGSNVVYDLTYQTNLFNCSIISGYNNVNGHAVVTAGSPSFINNYIVVSNTSANCLRGGSSITAKYSGNKFNGSTTPINANITQGIVNTIDNQGNLLM